MESLIVTWLSVGMVTLGHAFMNVLGRVLAARAVGMRPVAFHFRVTDAETWAAAPLRARVAVRAAGPIAAYAWPVLLAAMGTFAAGRTHVDETTMRVEVAAGGPADVAGVKRGDRIVSVDGAGVHDWGELKKRVSDKRGERIDVEIERAGETVHATPVVSAQGKILIGPEARHEEFGLGASLARGLAFPVEIVGAIGRNFVRILAGGETSELAGPVGIVRESRGPSSVGERLLVFAMLASYYWLLTGAAFLFMPCARIRRPARSK